MTNLFEISINLKKRIEPSLPFGLFDQLSSMKDPVGHGPFQQIPIVTIFLQRSSLYPSTKMTSCTQINSGWFRRHNVLYSRTTRWRGPYYQFCLAKLLILFFSSSQLFSNDVFFIHSTPTTKNKSLRRNNHTQTQTLSLH